jgi:hypothetical protein
MITDPISSSQVVDVPVTFSCIQPTCKNLNSVLLAIDSKLDCDPPDFTTLDFGCVPEADNLKGVLQNILNEITCTTPTTNPVPDTTITGLTTCSTDHWNCGAPDACLTITNTQDPGNITLKVVLQALINREVALGNTILQLCGRITTLEETVAAQQLTITTIQTSCCA